MQENTRPKTDQSKVDLVKLITRRKIEENRAAHYEKRAREIEEENRQRKIAEMMDIEDNRRRQKFEVERERRTKEVAERKRQARQHLMRCGNYTQKIEEEKRRLEEATEKARMAKQQMMIAKQNAVAGKGVQLNQQMKMAMGKGLVAGNMGR